MAASDSKSKVDGLMSPEQFVRRGLPIVRRESAREAMEQLSAARRATSGSEVSRYLMMAERAFRGL